MDLTQGTAHAILKTLCDRGWVSRDPVTKMFSLGPALAVVGVRTDIARPLAHAARAAALDVSREVGYAGSVVERFGEALVITAFEGDDSREPAGIPGDRIPFVPPFGVAFAAWDPESEQRAWIERAAADNTALTERLEQVLARTRERGFDVDWTTPALGQAAFMLRTLQSDGLPPHVRDVIDQLLVECITVGFLAEDDSARKAQPVATIAAPVFDHRDRVALIVCVHPLRALSMRQINSIGRRLTAATTAASSNHTPLKDHHG